MPRAKETGAATGPLSYISAAALNISDAHGRGWRTAEKQRMACKDRRAMDLARILASRPLAPKLDPHVTLGEDGPRTTRFRPKTRPGTTRRRHSLSPIINYCSRGGFSQKEHYGDGPRTRSLGCKQALRPPPSQKPNSPCTWSGYNRTNPSNQTDGNRIYGLGTGWFAAGSKLLTHSIRFLQLSPSLPRLCQ